MSKLSPAGDVDAVEVHRSRPGRGQAENGLEGGGLARPVAAQQGNDVAFGNLQRDALEDVELPDEGVDVLDLEQAHDPVSRS